MRVKNRTLNPEITPMQWIVCYDIHDNRRRRQACKILRSVRYFNNLLTAILIKNISLVMVAATTPAYLASVVVNCITKISVQRYHNGNAS